MKFFPSGFANFVVGKSLLQIGKRPIRLNPFLRDIGVCPSFLIPPRSKNASKKQKGEEKGGVRLDPTQIYACKQEIKGVRERSSDLHTFFMMVFLTAICFFLPQRFPPLDSIRSCKYNRMTTFHQPHTYIARINNQIYVMPTQVNNHTINMMNNIIWGEININQFYITETRHLYLELMIGSHSLALVLPWMQWGFLISKISISIEST